LAGKGGGESGESGEYPRGLPGGLPDKEVEDPGRHHSRVTVTPRKPRTAAYPSSQRHTPVPLEHALQLARPPVREDPHADLLPPLRCRGGVGPGPHHGACFRSSDSRRGATSAGMPPTCPPPRIPREGPTPSRRGPPPPRRPQVAHDDPEHTALKEFNALWKRSCAPSGLLVFSTGRSLAKYHQLRAFAPDLQVRRAPDAGGGRGPATPAPPAARPGPAAALAGAQSPRATAPPTPPAPGTRHPPPPRARSTRTCSCAPSGRRSTTWARGSRRWTRAGWRTCPRGGTAPHARPWPRASRPWRPRSRRSSAPTSCPTRSMGAPGRARPSQRGSRAP